MSWITFGEPRQKAGQKTLRWFVRATDTSYLGTVQWFARWRKYVFYPGSNTVYEEDCLREIATFCETRTAEHRAAKRKAAPLNPPWLHAVITEIKEP